MATVRVETSTSIPQQANYRLQTSWREFVAGHGGWAGNVYDGRYSHAHAAHGNRIVDAVTGETIGCFTALDAEPEATATCGVCRDFTTQWE